MQKHDHDLNKAKILIIEPFLTTDGPLNLSEIQHPRIKEAFEELHGRYITGTKEAAFYLPNPRLNKEKSLNQFLNQLKLLATKNLRNIKS
jgi:hypothetical protein